MLYALAQPGWDLWPLGFVCGLPLLLALEGRRAGARAGLGWITGTAATCCSTVVPAAVSSSSYFGVPMWQALVIALSVGQLFGAASFAGLAALVGPLPRCGPASAALRLALAWTGAEYLRSTLFTGLPWLLLGQALTPAPAWLQPAAWLGVGGVTFLLAAWTGALFECTRPGAQRRRSGALQGLAVLATFALAWLSSPLRGPTDAPGSVAAAGAGGPESMRVLLVQGDLPNQRRSGSRQVAREIERLFALSDRPGIDLAIWPENAVRALLPVNQELVDRAFARLEHRPRHLLFGAPRTTAREPGVLRNSALLFEADGSALRPVGSHDKVHLLPFAEYTPAPFRALGLEGYDTRAGDAPRVLDADGRRLGTLVCYEIAFESLARALARDGADVLVNVSNDGWFGRTGAVEQHFAAAVFRAVETGRPVLRATNTGITAAVDAAGRVVARAPLLEPHVLELDVVPGGPATWYARTGNWLGPTSLVAALCLCAVSARTASRNRRTLSV